MASFTDIKATTLEQIFVRLRVRAYSHSHSFGEQSDSMEIGGGGTYGMPFASEPAGSRRL